MPEVIYLNGKFVSPAEAVVPINDRGFLFGDAVYEVIRSYDGRLWALERHLRRLQHGLESIDIQGVDVGALAATIEDCRARSEFPNALVYIHITRGAAPRSHAYSRDLKPLVLVHVRDITPLVAAIDFDGVAAVTAPDLRWRRCDIKSTNLLPNVLARTAAHDQGAHEAILFDEEGFITEAAGMAVFWVEGDVLLTTPSGPAILPSITRALALEAARDDGIPVREERVPRGRLQKADEILLGSTTHEVCPVVKLDGAPVGNGRLGPITSRLQQAFRRRVKEGRDASP